MRTYRERAHRLPDSHYRGRRCVAFTACLKHHSTAFSDAHVVAACVELLARALETHGCSAPIYTFMPDHLHVLILGESDESDTKAAMTAFKTATGWWFYRNRPGVQWQQDYWDHIVRDAEGWETQAKYIAANPVRAGLCADVCDWPFTGSIGYDLAMVFGEAFW